MAFEERSPCLGRRFSSAHHVCRQNTIGVIKSIGWEDLRLADRAGVALCYNREFMVQFFIAVLGALRVFVRARGDTALEILALRQQVAVLKRQRPRSPLNSCDRLFWTTLRRIWPRWADVLLIVKPET